jgi:hypothetical protein
MIAASLVGRCRSISTSGLRDVGLSAVVSHRSTARAHNAHSSFELLGPSRQNAIEDTLRLMSAISVISEIDKIDLATCQ